MAGEAYFHGRDIARLELDKDGADHLYAAQLLDDQSWIGRTYQNCTFANLSFKNVEIDNCSFVNCVFVSCYFRRSLFKSSRFAACRFLDCDFPRVRIHASDFAYARFDRCFIAFNEIGNALPSEHNLREDLARNLANEANAAGASRDAREFRLVAVCAQQADQWNAFRGTSNWYKTHYKGADKARAGYRAATLWLNGRIWGYGESTTVLLVNTALSVLLVFPILFYLARGGLDGSDSDQGPIRFGQCVRLSIDNVLHVSGISNVVPSSILTQCLVAVEALVGIVLLGLFVTLLFQWIIRR